MRVLFVIFVLSVGALLWAAIAVARHIRRHEPQAALSEPDISESGPATNDSLLAPGARQPGH
jgi:hypothetical protein